MEQWLLQLNEREIRFKEIYEHGGKALIEQPMTLSQYQALPDSWKIFGQRFKEYHKIYPGVQDLNTVRDIPNSSAVEVVMHERYCYPIFHNHDYVEIGYIYSGRCVHFLDKEQIPMQQGDFFILSPNTNHAISATADDSIVLDILVSLEFLGHSFLRILQCDPVIIHFFEDVLYGRAYSPYLLYRTGEDSSIQDIALKLLYENHFRDELSPESISLLVRQLFLYLVRHCSACAEVSNAFRAAPDNTILAIILYITQNYEHITLRSLAEHFGYNDAYLGQLLKRSTGKTFSALLNETRLARAKELLSNSNLSITDIAQKSGFYDASHFSKTFRSFYGVSPAAYRKKG